VAVRAFAARFQQGRHLTVKSVKKDPEKRPRQKAEIARTKMIEAARELFAARGYARTTTRDIAYRADSSEVLLFRYFQSKANLFREAVVDPFDGFLKEFLPAQMAYDGDGPFGGSQDFVNDLFSAVTEHRDILFTLISTRIYESGAPEEQVNAAGFKEYFRVAVERIESELHEMGVKPAVSPAISSRISFAAVLATAMFRDWLFTNTDVDHADVVVALNKFIIGGMAGIQGCLPDAPKN